MRAAAAQVGVVIGSNGMLAALRSALAAETDPEAAREELAAWLTIGGAAELDRYLEQVQAPSTLPARLAYLEASAAPALRSFRARSKPRW